MTIANQKAWFEVLAKAIKSQGPIYVAKNRFSSGIFRPGKQSLMGIRRLPYDHRTIAPLEVVIELDAPSYAQNCKYAKQFQSYLISQEIPAYFFWSGNKSIHIHIFLSIDIKNKELQVALKSVMKQGFNIFKELRLQVARDICEGAGISTSLIGNGKIIDLQKLSWNDLGGKSTLIRACGGHNKKTDKIDPTIIKGGFKTYYEELPLSKPKDNDFDSVQYPKKIEKYVLQEGIVAGLVQKFQAVVHKKEDVEFTSFSGKYLNLPCTQKIIEGIVAGSRSFGALIISLAARLDGYKKEDVNEILKKYVKNCTQLPDPFSLEEAEHWRDWVYSQPTPYWSCGLCVKHKFCFKADCEYHSEKYEEELSVFAVDTPLDVIKKALDILIVGEDKAKMLLFLLYLTKEHTRGAIPEWCLLIDGPASSGKTHIMKAVAMLYGEEGEEWFSYSRFTRASLNHIDEEANTWIGKIVIIEELQGSKDVTEQLRVAISEGKLKLFIPQETFLDDGTKGHTTIAKEVKFDNLFVTCNAEDFTQGEQLLSRAWIIGTDVGASQTKAVMDYYLGEFSDEIKREIPNLGAIRTALKFLEKPDRIVFPFANELIDWLPSRTVRGRRDIKKFIALVKASAYFHQKQRKWLENESEKILIADWRDISIVFDIAGSSLNASTQGLSAQDVADWSTITNSLRTIHGSAVDLTTVEFTTGDMCRWLKIPKGSASKKAAAYINLGVLENKSRPPLPANYQVTNDSVKTLDIDYYVNQCKEMIKGQESKIKEWIKAKGGSNE